MLMLKYLLIIVVFNLQVNKATNCPSGWIELNSSCYYFGKTKTTWKKARGLCQQIGGDLAVPKDRYDNQAIFQTSEKQGLIHPYIGLFREKSDKMFYTIQNTKPIFTNWHRNEPNNRFGVEDCVHYYYSNSQWNDVPCKYETSFICQRDYNFSGPVSSTCLRCICNVESGCRKDVRCGDNGRSC
ncbi:perlucin-like protein [Xenia sp. Carnegie-2017]|uniref:perlucin-like protein n=1 Tax=Xenia sp. Carnegie-2017 TaxID=2897299 RepID=UPI001F0475FB|nr:perlucin-like protein [Xenia sp. Carnegie-2017]